MLICELRSDAIRHHHLVNFSKRGFVYCMVNVDSQPLRPSEIEIGHHTCSHKAASVATLVAIAAASILCVGHRKADTTKPDSNVIGRTADPKSTTRAHITMLLSVSHRGSADVAPKQRNRGSCVASRFRYECSHRMEIAAGINPAVVAVFARALTTFSQHRVHRHGGSLQLQFTVQPRLLVGRSLENLLGNRPMQRH